MFSRGRFSHALVCSSPPAFVEAIGTGVSVISLGRSFSHDLSNVRVLRHPDRAVAATAAKLAQLEVGRDYSVAKAVASVFPRRTRDAVGDHGIFCSALVAQVYASAGSPLCETPVERTTPGTIEKAPGLLDVTATVFRPALAPNNIARLSALDGDRVPTASAKQTVISSRCAELLFDTADRLARTVPETGLEVIPSFYGLLDFVRRAVEGVDEMPEAARATLLDIDRALAAFIGEGEMSAMLRDVMAEDDAEIMHNVAESFAAVPDIDVGAMARYPATSRVELAQRRAAIGNMTRWGPSDRRPCWRTCRLT